MDLNSLTCTKTFNRTSTMARTQRLTLAAVFAITIFAFITYDGNIDTYYKRVTIKTVKDTAQRVQSRKPVRETKNLKQFLKKKSPLRKTWIEEQMNRRTHLSKICEKQKNLPNYGLTEAELKDRYVNTLVDNKHRVIYCGIQKIGTTTWIDIFRKLNGLKRAVVLSNPVIRKHGLVPFTLYSPEEQRKLLKKYTTFIVVRHPIVRLVSAYKDKFQLYLQTKDRDPDPKLTSFKYGRDIIRLYRNITHPWNYDNRYGYNITFEEFIRYITDPDVPEIYKVNKHWSRYQTFCPICEEFRPDFILHQETFDTDKHNFLELVFGPKAKVVEQTKVNRGNQNTSQVTESLFHSLPRSLQTRLLDRYEIDFELFGYEKMKIV